MPHDFPVPLGHLLNSRVEHDDGVAMLSLAGEFDLAGAEPVEALLEEIEVTGPRAIVVDLNALTFLDSSGLRVLFEACYRSRGVRPFAVLNGSGPAHRVLSMTGIDRVLTMVSSVDELSEATNGTPATVWRNRSRGSLPQLPRGSAAARAMQQ